MTPEEADRDDVGPRGDLATQVRPYLPFVRATEGLPRAAFLDLVQWPCLYFPRLDDSGPPTKELALNPGVESRTPQTPHKHLGWSPGAPGISFLRPSEEHRYGRITLGRAPYRDIVIPEVFLSKLHAYFIRDKQQWTITDAGSTNGTTVDGQALEPARTVPLRSGARIDFAGEVEAVFLEPADLFEQLALDLAASR